MPAAREKKAMPGNVAPTVWQTGTGPTHTAPPRAGQSRENADRHSLLSVRALALALLVVVVGAGLALGIRALTRGNASSSTASGVGPPAAHAPGKTPAPPKAEEHPNSGSSSDASGSSTALQSYQGDDYTAQVPAAWTRERHLGKESGYLESRWRDPSDPDTALVIDSTHGVGLSPEESANRVRRQVRQASGYSELAFGPVDIGNGHLWRWLFEVPSSRRVDYFYKDPKCGVDLAILGSSSHDRFSALETLYERVASSARGSCP